MAKTPSFTALKEIGKRLTDAKLTYALGGSGLLYALNLIDTVNDWDITTDAPREAIENLLGDLEYQFLPPSGIYATEYRFQIKIDEAIIDLMGNFAIKTDNGIHNVKTKVTGYWKGIPLGSPAEWLEAYRLMGRAPKVALLERYEPVPLAREVARARTSHVRSNGSTTME